MTPVPVLLTIDTEYSSGAYRSGRARDEDDNYAFAIDCAHPGGHVGIHHQMKIMENAGIRGTFFVDPMPALVWGQASIDRIVQPILEGGHDVQAHCHTEWLAFAPDNGLSDLTGQHIKDFPLADQRRILAFGLATLEAAGAERPIAFRAGNYGANDDTLRALAALGVAVDSSFPAGLRGDCAIDAPFGDCRPISLHGVLEVPIAAIGARADALRHVQVTSLSAREMRAAISLAIANAWPAFVIVSHSFELFDRKRGKPNRIVERRFRQICKTLAAMPGADTMSGFASVNDASQYEYRGEYLAVLPEHRGRTLERYAEQALSNAFYA